MKTWLLGALSILVLAGCSNNPKPAQELDPELTSIEAPSGDTTGPVPHKMPQATLNTQPGTNPHQGAQQVRYNSFMLSRDAIVKQIDENESRQAVLRAEIEKTRADIELFNYSGRSVSENPYYDVGQRKWRELAHTLEERVRLDDQLKAIYAQYPEFSDR